MRLGSDGYRVGLIARRGELLEALAARSPRPGARPPRPSPTSAIAPRSATAIAEIEDRLGPADVMVANAGFGAPTRLDPLNIDDVEQTFRVNLMGVIYSIEAVLPGMLARRSGQLLAVSSLAGERGCPASRRIAPARRR